MNQLQQTTQDAIGIFQAGVHAVQADRLVRERLIFEGNQLQIDDSGELHRWKLHPSGRIIVVGAGKATFGMLKGLSASLQGLDSQIPVVGHVNVPEGTTCSSESDQAYDSRANSINVLAARPAGVNEPTELAVRGTKKIIDLCELARPSDTVIFLLSGGASALLTSPIEGITLAEKVQTTRLLSQQGAAIEELNAVRRGLSTVKAGGLASRCRAGRLITLVISDVLGDSLATIGSGPTWINNPPNIPEILNILLKYDKNQNQFPRAVYQTLTRRASEDSSSRSQSWLSKRFAKKERDNECELVHVVLANNATAVDAAGVEAVRRGYAYWMESARQSEGAAEDVGRRLARQCIGLKDQPNISCIISGGEPTVKLPDENHRGRGGRNQQLTLAALTELQKLGTSPSDWERMTLLSGGTDGEDGPTDAAGAWCDARTVASYQSQQLSPQHHLDRCDAYPFFENTDSLLITGPTHTNVCDLRVAIYDHTH
jgi:hydroxypyruvate reductase